NEIEALVLENNLIKKHKPPYNILLKDDKSYPFIRIDLKAEYPRIEVVRRLSADGAKYFGPYTSEGRSMMDLIHMLWPIRRCSRKFPQELNKERPCLNYHINKCLGPCNGYVTEEKYNEMVSSAMALLSGKHEDILKGFEKSMAEASQELNFELAAELRDKIHAIKTIGESQLVESGRGDDQDIIAFARADDEALVQVFFIRAGKMTGREHFMLNGVSDMAREDVMTAFVTQFYSENTFIPKEIVLEEHINDEEIVSKWLSEVKGNVVSLNVPQRGQKLKLVNLAHKNAMITLEQFGERIKREQERTVGAVNDITKALGFETAIERIEAYDISNIQGYESVGSMVVFENGTPKRSDYRKFRIKSVIGPNDYASMEEMLFRRFNRYFSEINGENADDKQKGKFNKIPDVIFIDGGKGQVSVAEKVLRDLGLDIPVCGMIKDDRHRTRGLIYKDKEINLSSSPEAFKLITRIQDEVHRFAVEYHRKLREKGQVHSVLDDIEGIGPARRKALIRHFASIEYIMAATEEELLKAEGMTKKSAKAVYDFFRK
ncbi:MAG: excinuclease ABC subunit UvrC, partial [Clostridiales bacterium]|nr:excinuclease ABC subunit UvrC [Clostridiales bacterium]